MNKNFNGDDLPLPPKIYYGIDIGTTKICATALSRIDNTERMQIMGFYSVKCNALELGQMKNVAKVRESVEKAIIGIQKNMEQEID
jgi:cell division ATPase FtsA